MAETIRTVVMSPDVPAGKAPYSHAVVVDNLVYTAGCVALDPATGNLTHGGIIPETQQTLRNLGNILLAAGSEFRKALKLNIYLADINDEAVVTDLIKAAFGKTECDPAWTIIQVVKLPLDCRVEIEAVAVRGSVVERDQSQL